MKHERIKTAHLKNKELRELYELRHGKKPKETRDELEEVERVCKISRKVQPKNRLGVKRSSVSRIPPVP